jgi:hypothetical protein
LWDEIVLNASEKKISSIRHQKNQRGSRASKRDYCARSSKGLRKRKRLPEAFEVDSEGRVEFQQAESLGGHCEQRNSLWQNCIWGIVILLCAYGM